MTVSQEITFEAESQANIREATQTYNDFVQHCSDKRVSTELAVLNSLRKVYVDKNIRCVDADDCHLLTFAKAGKAKATPITDSPIQHIETSYHAPSSRLGKELGKIKETVKFGQFKYEWGVNEFLVYVAEWPNPRFGTVRKQYILSPETSKTESDDSDNSNTADPSVALILAAGHHCAQLHREIYVFDMGGWSKNRELWKSVQKSEWEDVILDAEMKEQLFADIKGFFDSEALYREFGVPWKRGIILHGQPGNGKTISIKAAMKSLDSREQPVPSLYVKSLENCNGREYSIRAIFERARRCAPCLLIFEDLDSLVTDKIRSYFLNEVDGMENNDGILMIGSTNHLDKLDPAIAKRPSRFDRKYHFRLPAESERTAYAVYWRQKLARNPSIDFPSEIPSIVAKLTDGFSFAYLKELFVTSLLALARGGPTENAVEPALAAASATNGVETQDKAASAMEIVDIPEHLHSNKLLKTLQRQVVTLRREMDNTEKEAEAEPKASKDSKILRTVRAEPVDCC